MKPLPHGRNRPAAYVGRGLMRLLEMKPETKCKT